MQILSIMRVKPGLSAEQLVPHFEQEAADAWAHYADDRIRSMHFIADSQGVVFVWEAEDAATVAEAVAALPMARAGFLDIEIIPLKNWTGFAQLFAKPEPANA